MQLRTRIGALALALALPTLVAVAPVATAQELFRGEKPTDFAHLHYQGKDKVHKSNGSTITNAKDSTYGNTLKFRKVNADRRAEVSEAKGAPIRDGQTYYIGWRFKISNKSDTNCIFQWKSGGDHQQNYPVVLKTEDGKVKLEHYGIGVKKKLLFEAPYDANRWYTVAIKIKASSKASDGRVQFWWRSGGAEKLKTGGTEFTGRTYDGNKISPKWGLYSEGPDTTLYMDDLKMGTSLKDVFLG